MRDMQTAAYSVSERERERDRVDDVVPGTPCFVLKLM